MSLSGNTPCNPALTQPLLLVPEATCAGPAEMPETHKGARASGAMVAIDLNREDLNGTRLRHYELGARIGSGGMGQVFLARHVHLGKTFAIKFMAGQLARDPEANQRFFKEFRSLGRLNHPNIVAAVDAGDVDGLQYYVTEYLTGRDSASWLAERGPMQIGAACEVARQTALGLGYAHQAGLFHRDIKPTNLFLQNDGTVKILDFGLVCEQGNSGNLTVAGMVMGTLDFLSPEQADGTIRVDPRSDIYSLGATIVYLLSGQAPFPEKRFPTAASKLRAHLLEVPPWLADEKQDVPGPLRDILLRMMAKQPPDRFGNCEQVAEALAKYADPKALENWLAGACHASNAHARVRPSKSIDFRRWAGWISALALIVGAIAGIRSGLHSLQSVLNKSENIESSANQVNLTSSPETANSNSEYELPHSFEFDLAHEPPGESHSDNQPHNFRENKSSSARATTLEVGNRRNSNSTGSRVLSAPLQKGQ